MAGHPQHVPSADQRRQVMAMAGYGVPHDSIAMALEIAPKTLRKHYRMELDTGHIRANSKVAESLYQKATGDGPAAVTAAIWWSKARMGWSETVRSEMTGVDGGPIQTKDATDPRAAAMLIAFALAKAANADDG